MKNNIKENVKQAISLLASSLKKEICENAEKAPEEVKEKYRKIFNSNNVIENYFFEVIFPYQEINEGLLRLNGIKNEKTIWLLINSDFVENQYKGIIKKIEGWSCSADKSRTIMKALYEYLENEKPICFDYEAEYTFHLPKKVFNTEKLIVDFFEAIMSLHYGDPNKYLIELATMNLESEDCNE